MDRFFVYFLVLGLSPRIKCDPPKLSLKILKCTGDDFTPVSGVVEEKSGANFSLLCDLVSSERDSNDVDFHISWVKQNQQQQHLSSKSTTPNNNNNDNNNNNNNANVQFWREHNSEDLTSKSKRFYSIYSPNSEMNKAIKTFEPLRPEDRGKYICVSLKFGLYEVVEVVVQEEVSLKKKRPPFNLMMYKNNNANNKYRHETIFCSEQMFQCNNGVCIIHHYICDGKADCRDGSDESWETCHGDPCQDKLQCDDGRCIPTSWCCDRYHDPNCTVVNRPKCCQILSEPYEDIEFGSSTVIQNRNGARYIFISVCILSIVFVIALLLLILSKVLIYAKKSGVLDHSDRSPRNAPPNIETIALRSRSGAASPTSGGRSFGNDCRRLNFSSVEDECEVFPTIRGIGGGGFSRTPLPHSNNIMDDDCDVIGPLLFDYPLSTMTGQDFTMFSNNRNINNNNNNNNSSNSEDEPPPYLDVVVVGGGAPLNLNEPPPPYTSTEILNEETVVRGNDNNNMGSNSSDANS